MISGTMLSFSALNMEIQEMCKAKLDSKWRAKNVLSSFTRVYIITQGSATLEVNGTIVKMMPGKVYVVPAGLEFSYSCDDSCEKVFFHIALLLPDGRDVFQYIKECITINDPSAKDIIEGSINLASVENMIAIKGFLYSVVLKCLEHTESIPLNKYSDLIMKVLSYIDKNLSVTLSPEDISNGVFCSVSKLRKNFKSETGISMGKYINDRVLYYAEAQIRMTQKSLREISESLGYCDQFYFSRCFRAKYGVSPLKYRNKCQRFKVWKKRG